jgi:ketosteroid isomerase-like protein
MTTRSMALLLIFAAGSFAAEPDDGVREAASGWRKAVIHKDEAALQRFLADDLSYTHGNGKSQNKAEYIAAIKATGRYESFTGSETTIRVYGKTAVLTGFVDVKLAGSDAYRVRTIEVYVQNDGQWQLTAKQSARIGR